VVDGDVVCCPDPCPSSVVVEGLGVVASVDPTAGVPPDPVLLDWVLPLLSGLVIVAPAGSVVVGEPPVCVPTGAPVWPEAGGDPGPTGVRGTGSDCGQTDLGKTRGGRCSRGPG